MAEKKTTPNINLPLIEEKDYNKTKVTDFVQGIQGDSQDSAFMIIDAAFETKQDKITVNPIEDTTLKARKLKINGVVYKVSGDIDQIDTAMSSTSTNPVQNKVITAAIQNAVAEMPSTSDVQTMIDNAITGTINRGY